MTAEAPPIERVAVLGAGAWGAALACVAARAGRRVALWAHDEEFAREIARTRRSPRLPEAALPEAVAATADLGEALGGAGLALIATPSRAVAEAARGMAAARPEARVPALICSKGLAPEGGLRLSEAAAAVCERREIGALSGPSFAIETAQSLPTAVVIAAADAGAGPDSLAARAAASLGGPSFRPYITDDLAGVEICGAMKNVIALAAGMASGAGFGWNARAALATRGLVEMAALAVAMGGRAETVGGLAGAGDLMLTCSTDRSRNFAHGYRLGTGEAPEDGEDAPLVEGVRAVGPVTEAARARGVEAPICEAVRRVTLEGASFAEGFRSLWSRPLRTEPGDLDLRLANPGAHDEFRKVGFNPRPLSSDL
mgnify:CR=1 FL=1